MCVCTRKRWFQTGGGGCSIADGGNQQQRHKSNVLQSRKCVTRRCSSDFFFFSFFSFRSASKMQKRGSEQSKYWKTKQKKSVRCFFKKKRKITSLLKHRPTNTCTKLSRPRPRGNGGPSLSVFFFFFHPFLEGELAVRPLGPERAAAAAEASADPSTSAEPSRQHIRPICSPPQHTLLSRSYFSSLCTGGCPPARIPGNQPYPHTFAGRVPVPRSSSRVRVCS